MLKLESQKDYIIDCINNGQTMSQIGKDLNVGQTSIRSIVHKYLPNKKFRPNLGNTLYFENIDSDDKAYFVGFIASDGSLVKSTQSNGIALTITLNKKDKYILETLKDFINCETPVKDLTTKNQCRFVIQHKDFTDALQKHGIECNKSLNMQSLIHNIPKEFRKAFLRGYFDGDGSIFKDSKNRYYVSIRGTLDFLQDFVEEFELTSYSLKQYPYEKIGKLSTGSKDSIKKFFSMYDNSKVHLKRKHEIFNNFMEKHYQDQTISSS